MRDVKITLFIRSTKEILPSGLFEVLNSLKLSGITPTKTANISCKQIMRLVTYFFC